MSLPFVTTLRARAATIHLGDGERGERFVIRVEVPERWDVVRLETPASERVQTVKVAALQALDPKADQRDFVIKLRGFEVLDEQETLAEAGVVNGSIFLLTRRRRRPVR